MKIHFIILFIIYNLFMLQACDTSGMNDVMLQESSSSEADCYTAACAKKTGPRKVSIINFSIYKTDKEARNAVECGRSNAASTDKICDERTGGKILIEKIPCHQ